MFDQSELRGFSPPERQAVRIKYEKACDALDYFERKLELSFRDERLSASSVNFLKQLWRGVDSEGQVAMCSRAVWDAHAKAMILSHVDFGRGNAEFNNGDTRARLITLSPNVGIMPIADLSLPLSQLQGFADRAARKAQINALFTLDVSFFCPKRGDAVDTVALHVHGAMWSRNAGFKPKKTAEFIGLANDTLNTIGGPVAYISTRGWKAGGTLNVGEIAGLGWYASKLSCGVNTCYDTKTGRKSESSHTDWHPIHALRQLEVLSHVCLFNACWAANDGSILRMLWRNRVLRLLDCTLMSRQSIPHHHRTKMWAQVWRELATGYNAVVVRE